MNDRGEARPRTETERISVTFDPNVCQHSAVCLRTLPDVFDVRRRQWIMPDLAEPGVVAAAIERCPSGALRYQLKGPRATRFAELYAAFNARDIERVLSHLATDVDWPNAINGGRVSRARGGARLLGAAVCGRESNGDANRRRGG